jgi:dehydrogenase/reductase SDR family member 7B
MANASDERGRGMFKDQIWWITGASSGIGEALALELARRGATLILSGRNVAALAAVAEQCGETLILPFEAADYDAIPAIAEQAWGWHGRVHGLINNAGISQRSLAVDTDFSVYQRMIAVDLLGPIALTQANLPHMVAAGGGHIVAISSVAGIAGVAVRSAYCAAKHGLIGYHDSVRAENEHLGVQVHVIAPGSIRTNVSRNALNADGTRRGVSDKAIDDAMPASEAALAMLSAIADGKRELILATGVEAQIAALRRSDPDAAFDLTNAAVKAGYVEKMAADQNR